MQEVPTKKPTNSCMEAAKKQAEQMRKIYGPSNRELMAEIKILQQQVKLLTERVEEIANPPLFRPDAYA